MIPSFDADDYPTEDTLEFLSHVGSAGKALDYLRAAWKSHLVGGATENISAHEAAVVRSDFGDRYLRVSTGGWSGNEALLGALRKNTIVWRTTWQMSARGGLHIFKYPPR